MSAGAKLAALQEERTAAYARLADLHGRRDELLRQERQRAVEHEAAVTAAQARVLVDGIVATPEPPPAEPVEDYAVEEAKITARIADLDALIATATEAAFSGHVREAERKVGAYRAQLARIGRAAVAHYVDVLGARAAVAEAGAAIREMEAGVRHDATGQAQRQTLRGHLRGLGANPTEDQIIGVHVVALLDWLRRDSTPVRGLAERHGLLPGTVLYDRPGFPDPIGVRDVLPVPGLEV